MRCGQCKPVMGRQVGTHVVIMFVGESLGFFEQQEQKCFVGPAGKMLRDACKMNEINHYFLTNVVKCAPEGKPTFLQQHECMSYFWGELLIHEPPIVVPLGNTACRRVAGIPKISQAHGKIFKCNYLGYKYMVIPTFHPNPKNEYLIHDFLADLAIIKKEYDRQEGGWLKYYDIVDEE